jgi:hypothetical protein
LSDDALGEFREVQSFFRLQSVGLVAKDLHVVRAIAALAAVVRLARSFTRQLTDSFFGQAGVGHCGVAFDRAGVRY